MTATYRLQLRPGFGFDEARAILPYLRRLGISHVYLSPITDARRGSTHGYDVVDHTRIREELGGPEAFGRLVDALREIGLRLIIDFVPNHGSVGARNARWQDVLAHGRASRFARFFDIDWDSRVPDLRGKVLLPFLGRPYGEALDAGEITLVEEDGRWSAAYHRDRFALAPETWEEAAALAAGGRPSREALHALLERQYWRLAFWKTAVSEINYRRFFDVNELVALRMEDPEVFEATHTLLADLVRLDVVDGVRIDHVDGLYDPFGYLAALRALGPRQVWVEKILAPGELLPEGWPVEGSTGYDFMHEVTALLTYPGSRRALDRLWRRAAPDAPGWREEAYRSKQVVMQTVLSGDLTGLAHELDRIAERDYHTRDVTFEALREALADVIAGLQRYRTYLAHDGEGGAALLRETLEAARRRRAAGDPTPYDIIERVLLGAVREDLRADAAHWAHRFEQYCAPVAAKGVEDTACYRYLRLAAVNEVGGDPATIGMGLQAFHERGRARGARHPRTLLATSTHDAKRGEDTRMRMIALAELADDWRRLLAQLRPVLRRHRRRRGPSRADEYLFLQTLAALWEDGDRSGLADRLAAYMLKAAREAKLHTSWLHADPSYEEMLERFVRGVIADARTASILDPFAALLARYGFLNSITQTVLRLTAPGIPDVYQGSELLTLTLVDPDNRVAVDFERREQLLESLEPLLAEPTVEGVRAMAEARDERLKLYVTAALLRLRAAHPHLAAGAYLPLAAEGTAADHAVAYARVDGPSALLVIATRFPAVLERMEGWGDTSVPLPEAWADHTWRETLTGAEVAPGDAIRPAALALPWAVLLSP